MNLDKNKISDFLVVGVVFFILVCMFPGIWKSDIAGDESLQFPKLIIFVFLALFLLKIVYNVFQKD